MDNFSFEVKEELQQEVLDNMKDVTNNGDPYTKGIIQLADLWGRHMETLLRDAVEDNVAEVAQKAFDTADDQMGGVTGFMEATAARRIGKYWVRGEEFVKWYNRENISDQGKADEITEKGKIVNPSVLSL